MQLLIASLIVMATAVNAFAPVAFKARSSTVLFEDFTPLGPQATLGQKAGDPLWSEFQLREFTATYSEDVRLNPLDIIKGFFQKKEDAPAATVQSSVSLKVLEEKTALYVQGKIDAKAFKATLKSAFGDKLESVLPDILANLPANKRKL